MATMRRAAFCVLTCLAASSLPAAAQQTTGNIVGIVQDTSGAVLPGVTVTLSGERIMGVQTAVTDERGSYRFPSLPPGEYDLTFTLASFSTVKQTAVPVRVGATVERTITLAVANLAESVTVEGGMVTDTQTNRIATTYDKEWIDNAPLARQSFFDVLNSAPGIDPASIGGRQPTSFGGMVDQNAYQLDGIDLTDNFNGNATTLVQPNVDVLEQVEVLSLGAPAEYGNVQGAVFNVVTRQGSNNFHGSTAYYHQTNDLTGRNTTDAEDLGFPFTRIKYRDFAAQAGGPIVRDRLWFFGSYQYVTDSSSVRIDPQFADVEDTHNVFFKPNVQIADGHTLVGSYSHQQRDRVFGLMPNEEPIVQEGTARRVNTPGVAYTGVLNDRTVLEGRYAGFYVVHNCCAADGGGKQIGTRFENQDSGDISGAIFAWYEYHSERTTLSAKLSHHASAFLGAAHDFKFGFQYYDAPTTGLYSVNDRVYTYDDTTVAYGYEYSPFAYGGTARGTGVFVDDTVTIGDRLTLNLGLRYDHTHTRAFEQPELDDSASPTGNVFPGVDYYTWNTVSPRLGLNLKLARDGSTVLKAHYGRYYPGGNTGNFSTSVPSVSPTFFGPYDLATGQFLDLELAFDNTNLQFDPEQDPSKTDQYILGVEHELFTGFNLSATYVHKRSRGLPRWTDTGGIYTPITYVDNVGADASGRSFTVFQLVNDRDDRFFVFTTPEGTKSDVNAFSLSATKRMSDDWQLTTSVVFSKSTGDQIDGTTASLNFREFGRNPNELVNSDGLLPRDRGFVFKTQFLYTGLPWGFDVSANYHFAEGYPLRRRVRIPETNLNDPVQTAPRNDDDRFPSINALDLRAQKDFALWGASRASIFVDVFNVFNDDAHQAVVGDIATTPGTYNSPRDFLAPVRAMLGAKFTF